MNQAAVIIQENEDLIRARAYQYWEEEGRPDGRHEIHWQRAVASLQQVKGKPDLRVVPKVTLTVAEDVSLIDGIGPKIEKQLIGVGITTLTQIAALSKAELEAIDKKLALKGRSLREDWIEQAKALLKGGKPRAKIDQVKAAKK
jgi:predicted flap endonuclease-1-like 5' DNA nuclease